MEINNLYIYYNKNGQVVSRTPYCENGSIRQGSTFNLNLLFDKGFVEEGDAVVLYFKWPQREAQDLPYIAFYDDYNDLSDDLTFLYVGNKVFEKDFSKYGIQKGIEYDCWTFRSNSAITEGFPNLTELDGNLEIGPKIIKAASAGTDGNPNVITLGDARIFIEKDSTYVSNLKVSSIDLNNWLSKVEGLIPNQFVKKITPIQQDYSVKVEKIKVNYHDVDDKETEEIIDLPVPSFDENIVVNEISQEENQTAAISGTGKEADPLKFSFNMYRAKDGFGIVGFEIDENGDLIIYDERGENKQTEYYLDEETGELMVRYLEQ